MNLKMLMIRLLLKRACLLSLFRNEKWINKDLSLLINISSPKTAQHTFNKVKNTNSEVFISLTFFHNWLNRRSSEENNKLQSPFIQFFLNVVYSVTKNQSMKIFLFRLQNIFDADHCLLNACVIQPKNNLMIYS